MYFPFMIDVEGQRVVIIGGGKVALRKCRLFLEYGACVSVVSPEFCEEFNALADRVELISDVYNEKYLLNAFVLVAASSSSEVNRSAAVKAKSLGILVNSVDDPPNCSFFIPAVVHRGDLTVGLSTGGKSPALAAKLPWQFQTAAHGDRTRSKSEERHADSCRRTRAGGLGGIHSADFK